LRFTTFLTVVFPHLAAFRVEHLSLSDHVLTLTVSSRHRTARCPACHKRSRRVHSRFVRYLADTPMGSYGGVHLELHARRFRCLNAACARQTFRESFPEVAPRYQRRTPALQNGLEAVGFALGGQAGKRLATRLRLGPTGASRNTLLRLIRRAEIPSPIEPHTAPCDTDHQLRVLSVDDFAFRRGTRYGAILVDLKRHRVLDLLPDREAATFATWLGVHGGSEVAVVSRDRGGAFAEGARQGAPQATQVADRFHLLQNLGMALDRILIREHRVLSQVAHTIQPTPSAQSSSTAPSAPSVPDETAPTTTASQGTSPRPAPTPPTTATTRAERNHAAVEARRQARYERVVALQHDGHSTREIARRAGLCRNTVRRYLAAGAYTACAKRARRPHGCDAFDSYLRERWATGERTSRVLFAELRAQGDRGAESTVRQYLAAWREGPQRPGRRPPGPDAPAAPAPPKRRAFSARQTRWILLRPLDDLDDVERAYRTALCQESAPIATAQALAEQFRQMVRTRTRDDLDTWLVAASESGIPELVSFASGVQRDYAAVAAGLDGTWSQGQTEGQVNRLKLLKRQSYGRASFDLLRRQMLYHAA
jgi:transposase